MKKQQTIEKEVCKLVELTPNQQDSQLARDICLSCGLEKCVFDHGVDL